MILDRRRACTLLGPLLGGAWAGLRSMAAEASGYPTRPVTVVVSFAAGGMTDTVSRFVGNDLSKAFGQQFVVENRPGAAGQIATEYVSRRPPDGYTLLVSATGHVIGPAVQKVSYRPVEDFAPIALLARAPNLLLVNDSVPATDVPSLVSWMKKQADVPYSTAGLGGSTHLAGEIFRQRSGAPLSHVPYKGAAPAINDLVAGHVKFGIQDSSSAAPFLASGRLRAIAVTTLKRSRLFPDIPTLDESGFPGFDLYTWLGFYAPARTPAEIVNRLNAEANRLIKAPASVEWLRNLNSEPGDEMTPDRFAGFVGDETRKWAEVVRTSGVKFDT